MIIIQNKFQPLDNDLKLFNFIYSNDFPFYYQKGPSKTNTYFYGHILMKRSDDENVEGTPNSDNIEYFKDIFFRICDSNNIKVKLIYRMAINSNFAQPEQFSGIHEDHNFEHTNFIMYLSEFSNGETYIFNDKDQAVDTIKPELYKYVFFNGPHAAGTCLPGERRLVFVVTFREKD